MPTYDYHCPHHGDFELVQRVSEHAKGLCPTCGDECAQVLRKAPVLDIEGMADAGLPSAFEKSGDRMTKRHLEAGQYHNSPSPYWRD